MSHPISRHEPHLTRAQLRAASRYVDGICAIIDWAKSMSCPECGVSVTGTGRCCSRICRQRRWRRLNPRNVQDAGVRYRERKKARTA